MAPGPAPSPPRRQQESGYGPRSGSSFPEPESQAEVLTERYDEEDLEEEMPTANGVGEPSTLNRGPVTVPRDVVQASPRGRANVMQALVPFEDETQARSVEDPILETVRREAAAVQQRAPADLAVAYDALPSLEVRPPFDSYEAAFSERDPVTQAASFSERDPVTRAVPREEVYERLPDSSERQPRQQAEEDAWGRREGSGSGSGSGSRPVPAPPHSYEAPVRGYDEPSLPWGEPPPPAQPSQPAQSPGYAHARGSQQSYSDMPPPAQNELRTATPDAWGTPQAPVQGPMAGQGYLPAPMQPMPPMQPIYVAMPGYGMAANQLQQPMPMMMQQPGYYPAMQPPMPMQTQLAQQPMPMQGYAPQAGQPRLPSPSVAVSSPSRPVSTRTTSTRSGMTVGRFAWFVAGSAFGITFAFFATGFFFGGNKAPKDELAPAVQLQLPAAAQPAAQAPVPMVAPAPLPAPVVIAPVAPAPLAIAPTAPIAPAAPVAPQAFAPASLPNAAPAPAPRFVARPARQPAAPRRPAPQSASEDAPAPAPAPKPEKAEKPAGGGDVSDLLGAGLKP